MPASTPRGVLTVLARAALMACMAFVDPMAGTNHDGAQTVLRGRRWPTSGSEVSGVASLGGCSDASRPLGRRSVARQFQLGRTRQLASRSLASCARPCSVHRAAPQAAGGSDALVGGRGRAPLKRLGARRCGGERWPPAKRMAYRRRSCRGCTPAAAAASRRVPRPKGRGVGARCRGGAAVCRRVWGQRRDIGGEWRGNSPGR